MTPTRDIVIEGAIAVTLGRSGVIADAEIVIRGDRLEGIGRRAKRRRPNSVVIDGRGRVAIPGLVNAHLHSEFLLLKGLVEERRLSEWEETPLYDRAWDWVRDPSNLGHVRNAYLASYAECLAGGTTFIGEFNCADAAIPASVEAMRACGLRGVPTVDLGRREKFLDIEELGCLHAINDEEGLTREELERAKLLLAAHPRTRFTMHAAETSERMAFLRARMGQTTIALLDAHGLLGPHLLLSHAVHVTPAEIDRIVETHTKVVSSPVAEMKLADGVSPIAELLRRGVPVALGTDAAVCNNGCDMFQEIKAGALLQKVTNGAHVVTAETALRMGTIHGAHVFDRGHDLGTLEPGKLADVVLVDARSPRMLPLIHDRHHSNVIANLVYAATASDVTDVWVAGEPVLRERHHQRIDTARVYAGLQASAEALHRAIAPSSPRKRRAVAAV